MSKFNFILKSILLVYFLGLNQTVLANENITIDDLERGLKAAKEYVEANNEKCKESVKLLRIGEKAECTGFLFSPEAEKKASQAYDDAKYYKDLSDLLNERKKLTTDEIKILDERLKLYQNQSHLLAEQVNKKEREDFWQKTLYFTLGIAVTSLAIYGASKLND